MSKKFDKESVAQSWIESAERDWKTMNHLVKSRDYAWSLFLGHLVIEKLLKALIVKQTNKQAPFTHNLTSLAKNMELTLEQISWLDEITTFNLNVRYDDAKIQFYKKSTKPFTGKWIDNIKILRKWLKRELSQ